MSPDQTATSGQHWSLRPMMSLSRLIRISLIISGVLVFHPSMARGQSTGTKPEATGGISGRVTLAGKAAPGITVAAFALETINRRGAAAKSVTDTDGRYRLHGLPPAQYQIASLTPNLTASEQGNDPGFSFYGSSKNVVLAAGEEVENIDLKLIRGGVITGRVTDADDKPVIDERIALQPVDQNGNPLTSVRLPSMGEMYVTDDRGIYRIFGLPAGRFKVSVGIEPTQVMNAGFRGYYTRTFYPDTSNPVKAQIVELSEGTEATNIDIRVSRRERTYNISGRVVDSETGNPIAGVRMASFPATQNPERAYPVPGGITGPNGEFRINGLAPGRYGTQLFSQFEPSSYYSEITYFEVVDKDVTGVEVKAIYGLTISGTVMSEGDAHERTFRDLSRLRISAMLAQTARPTSHSVAANIAADGTFTIGGLKPGRVTLQVYPFAPSTSRPSIARIERDGVGMTNGFEVLPGQSISGLRVLLTFGTGAIRGTIRFEGGTLPPDTRVHIRATREGARDVGGSLDSRNRFLIKDLSPGTYEVILQVFRSQIPPQKQLVQVTNGAETDVTFVVDLTPKEQVP